MYTLASDTDSEDDNDGNFGTIAFGNVEGIVDRRSNSSDSCESVDHEFITQVIVCRVCLKTLAASAEIGLS